MIRHDRLIIGKVTCNRRLYVAKLKVELSSDYQIDVSKDTIRRRLKVVGFKGKVAKRKPFILVKNQKMRLCWAKIHSKWTIKQWKTVLWTDETKINQFGSDGIIRTWQKKGESIIKKFTRATRLL